MNKLITKIMARVAGFAMAIGVGVGVAANNRANAVYASTNSYSATTYSGGNITGEGVVWTGSGVGGSSYVILKSGASLTSNGFSGIDLSEDISFTIKTRTYGGANYKTSTVRAYSDSSCTQEITDTPAEVNATSSTLTNKTGTLTFANNASASNVYFKITSSTTSSSNGPGISEISFTYTETGGNTPTLQTVTLSGSLTKTSYTTEENWDSDGLVVTGTYSDSSEEDLTSAAIISYYSDSEMTSAVANPSALGIGVGKTVYIKATASGVSNTTGYPQTVDISAPSYTNTTDYTEGETYVIYDGEAYLRAVDTNTQPERVDEMYNATPFTIALTDNNTFSFENDGKYLYATNTNNGVRFGNTSDSWVLTSVSGGYTFQDVNNDRYLSSTPNNTNTFANGDWRCYTSRGTGITALTLVEYDPTIPLSSISLSGEDLLENNVNIGSSDNSSHTINVALNPTTSTDQVINIAHHSGVSGLVTFNSSATCVDGIGSFTIAGTGVTSGTETIRVSGNTQTGVYADFTVTALDDSIVYYTVTFNSNGGSSNPVEQTIEEGHTFSFPNPGTKEHYSFDGWTSTGSAPFYAVGATSPAVTADITYSAHWTEDAKYTVTYVAGLNGSGSFADANNYGGSYLLLSFNDLSGISAAEGYRFKNYTVSGIDKDPSDSIELNSSIEVTVNFEEIPLEYVVTFGTADGTASLSNFNNSSYVIPSGVLLDNIQGSIYGKNDNTSAAIRFGKSGATGSFDVTISEEYYIKKVVANLKYYSSDSTAKFAVTPDGGEAVEKTMTNNFANYEFDVSASYANKVTLGTTINGKRAYLAGFTIVYDYRPAREMVRHTLSTLSFMKFNYSQNDDVFSYSETYIRFGGFISKTLWEELDNESSIEGYGVIVTATENLSGKTIKEKFNEYKTNENTVDQALEGLFADTNIKKVCVDVPTEKANPATATNDQKQLMGVGSSEEEYYTWTFRKSIALDKFADDFTGVAFIKIDGDIVFLKETTCSFKALASSSLDNTDPSDPAYDALQYIVDNN